MHKERFENIDFLRFLGAMAILCFHISVCMLRHITEIQSCSILTNFRQNVTFAEFWVDFFFIISGFFFYKYTDFSISFKNFFLKKYIRFVPLIIFAIFLYWLLAQFNLLHYQPRIDIFKLLLLNNVGLTTIRMGNIHSTWFISALFWSMMMLFYLKKICPSKVYNFILGLAVFFCYVYIINTTRFAPSVKDSFLCIGVLRAIGGLSIGYFINEIYTEVKQTEKSFWGKIFITAIELYLFGFIFYYTFLHKMSFSVAYPLLTLYFIALFILFLLKNGYVSKFLDNNFSVILGKYSYSIFVMHIIIFDLIRINLWSSNIEFLLKHPILNLLLPIFGALITGIISYHLVEQPATKYLNKKLLTYINSTDEKPTRGVKPAPLLDFKYFYGKEGALC